MLPLISSLVSFSRSIATIFFVFRIHPAINLHKTSSCVFDLPNPFLLPSDMFRPSLLLLLPLSVAPIGWSLTPFISLFLFILTTLALLSWIPECVSRPPPPPFFMLRYLAFHTFCFVKDLGLSFVGLYLPCQLMSVSRTPSWVLIFKFLPLLP